MAASWTCGTCTYINESGQACEMCETPKPGEKLPKATDFGGAEEQSDELKPWVCKLCTSENEFGRLSCLACMAARDRSSPHLSDVVDTSGSEKLIKGPPPPLQEELVAPSLPTKVMPSPSPMPGFTTFWSSCSSSCPFSLSSSSSSSSSSISSSSSSLSSFSSSDVPYSSSPLLPAVPKSSALPPSPTQSSLLANSALPKATLPLVSSFFALAQKNADSSLGLVSNPDPASTPRVPLDVGAPGIAPSPLDLKEPHTPAVPMSAPPKLASENAEIASQRQSLRAELQALKRRICKKGFASNHPFLTKKNVIRELCLKAQELIEKLLQLDWLETQDIAGWLQKLNQGAEKDEMIGQPAKDKTPEGLVKIANVVDSIFQLRLRHLAELSKIAMSALHVGPVKELDRVIAKLHGNPNSAHIFDLNRATLVCKDLEEFQQVIFNMPIVFNCVRQIKNKFKQGWTKMSEPPCMFYQVELGTLAGSLKIAQKLELNGDLVEKTRRDGAQVVELLEPGGSWIVEIQVTTYQFWITKGLCHPIYEVLRVEDLPPRCPMCLMRTDLKADEEQKSTAPQTCVCLIGSTGVGKSSLGNLIGNLTDQQKFETSSVVDSCTTKTLSRICTWSDDNKKFVLMDTPGLGDSGGRDLSFIADMANNCKRQEYISLFVLTFNGAESRLNGHMQGLLKIFVSMFGANFLNNVCVVFTHWPHTTESRLRRMKSNSTERERTEGFNSHFAKEFNYTGKPIPCFFLDCMYDTSDPVQVGAHKEVLEQIKELALSLKPFECQDVCAVHNLRAQSDKKLLDLKAELERKELESKEKERAAEDKINQILMNVAKEAEFRLQDEATVRALKEMIDAEEKEAALATCADDNNKKMIEEDMKMARDIAARDKEARDKAFQSQRLRQEMAAHAKVLSECEQELDTHQALFTHQNELPVKGRRESLRTSLCDLQTIQVRLSSLEPSLNMDLMNKRSILDRRCQTLIARVTGILSDSGIEQVVIHAVAPAIVIPKDGNWNCSNHQCALGLELRSMPYGPKEVKQCECGRSLTVSFHCAGCSFDICPFCAADFAKKPTWRFALHPHLLVLQHREVWSCHLCPAKSAERKDGAVYMCEVSACEFYACIRCAAGASVVAASALSLGDPPHMSPEIKAMWDMIQMLYQGLKPEVFVQQLPTAEMTASIEDMFLGLSTFETAIANSCQLSTWDRSVWQHQLAQPLLWSRSYFAIMLSCLQQSLLVSCYNSSWDSVAFAGLLLNA